MVNTLEVLLQLMIPAMLTASTFFPRVPPPRPLSWISSMRLSLISASSLALLCFCEKIEVRMSLGCWGARFYCFSSSLSWVRS
jgi:hypothetical protein